LLNPSVEISDFIAVEDDAEGECDWISLEFEGDNTEYKLNGDGILTGEDITTSLSEDTRIWLGIFDDSVEEPWPLIPFEFIVYRPTLIMCGQC
jgi:hypothetical protein